MVTERLQLWLDLARSSAPQRWALGTLGVAAIAVASLTIGVSSGSVGWPLGIAVALAIVATIEASSYTSIATIVVLIWHWLLAVDNVTSPTAVVVGVCIFIFHAVLSLIAATPHGATVHVEILRSWAARTSAIAIATSLVWLLVAIFDRRDAPGSTTLTFAALAVLAGGAVGLRHQHAADTTD